MFEQHIRNDGYREFWKGKPTQRLLDQIHRELDINLNVNTNSKDNLRTEKVYDVEEGKGLWR